MQHTLILLIYLVSSISLAIADELIRNSETELDTSTTLFSSAFSPQLIEQRRKIITEKQILLKNGQNSLSSEKIKLQEEIKNATPENITQKVLEQAEIQKEITQIELEKWQLEYQSTEETIKKQKNGLEIQKIQLDKLQKNEENKPKIDSLIQDIALRTEFIELEQQNSTMLQAHIALAKEQVTLAKERYQAFKVAYSLRLQLDLESSHQQIQQQHLARAIELRKLLDAMRHQEDIDTYYLYLLRTQIQEADEKAKLVEREVKIAILQQRMEKLNLLTTDVANQPISKGVLVENKQLLTEVEILRTHLTEKINLLQQQKQLAEKNMASAEDKQIQQVQQTEKIFIRLINALQAQLIQLDNSSQMGHGLSPTLEIGYQQTLHRILLKQRQLPTTPKAWQQLASEFLNLPSLFFKAIKNSLLNLWQKITQINYWVSLIYLTTILLVFLNMKYWLKRRLERIVISFKQLAQQNFVTNSLFVLLSLILINLRWVAAIGIIALCLLLLSPMNTTVNLILTLLLTVFVAKVFVNLFWILLSTKHLLQTTHRSKFYRQLRIITIIISSLAGFTLLGHNVLPIGPETSIWIDSLFMLSLSLTFLPAMRLRTAILQLFTSKLKRHWLFVIHLISFVFPLAILAVVLLSLIGYINLGWSVAKHLSLSLIILTIWLIARGWLQDTVVVLKNTALKSGRYGLLWTQDIIPMAHNLLALTLFAFAILLLFLINGWYDNIAVKANLNDFFNFSLFSLANKSISLKNLLLLIFGLWGIFWFGSWCRQITYRWIYSNISDLGIRHSLSVFTQYFVVLIGLLVTLRLIGLDLTTLAVFAGALGVGIGIGLQNIANNFLSGILLLLERPLRAGDYVNIGGIHEGEVTQIGIRSLTLKTWDYTEVIVPNSEIISSAFTNWTHSNQIMRTVLYINVRYESDPRLVEKTIYKVLNEFHEILHDPKRNIEKMVLLSELTEFSMKFRISYHINVYKSGLLSVRSAVLLMILERLQSENIKLAYPQQELHFKSISQKALKSLSDINQ